ncbi:PREDICTED: uncharacterized protein LOC101310108 isoform 2 [Fragaria vesca subsp. vesca]|uniref:uncharacterized protein LOC101310108 n=1 Tax=Fragaria vesca subsp. vesca TaxID=101020 RepID=UPI0002C33417|nr:PREDICTED: uncharacterized protein LOC101310108 [Fragaria vesca subsp. vesca]
MGTKIEYSINILGASQSSNSLAVHRVDDWDYFQKVGLKQKYQKTRFEDNLRYSVDRMLDKHNMDTIRKTMQMHEDTFRHQICELHRLYSVQKMLMDELKQEINQNRIWGCMTSNADHIHIQQSQLFNQQHATAQTSSGYNIHLHRLREDPSSRERSGSCSGEYTMKISRGFDLERPAAEEDISTGVSTIDQDQTAPSSNMALIKSNNMRSMDVYDEDSEEVELTLSIGSSKSKKRSKSNQLRPHLGCSELVINKEKVLDSPTSLKSDRGDCSDPTTPMSSSSATVDQERKQPHWLFHGLKLK